MLLTTPCLQATRTGIRFSVGNITHLSGIASMAQWGWGQANPKILNSVKSSHALHVLCPAVRGIALAALERPIKPQDPCAVERVRSLSKEGVLNLSFLLQQGRNHFC